MQRKCMGVCVPVCDYAECNTDTAAAVADRQRTLMQ